MTNKNNNKMVENLNSCDYCNMYENCTQTYSECRQYNPELWKEFEKQVKIERKEIFNKMLIKME